jgi:hypothetical protein
MLLGVEPALDRRQDGDGAFLPQGAAGVMVERLGLVLYGVELPDELQHLRSTSAVGRARRRGRREADAGDNLSLARHQ